MRTTLFLIILLSAGQVSAQNDLEEILWSSQTFASIVEEGNAYFARKHPGMNARELSSGTFRD
ncbi:MAG: hypothetical protein AAFR97_14185, partial [Bacteroidota bacterium]